MIGLIKNLISILNAGFDFISTMKFSMINQNVINEWL